MSTVELEDFVPASHPLRPIHKWMNEALARVDAKFLALYEADVEGGRPSIAPERPMRGMLLQVLYGIRGERQLVEPLSYNHAVSPRKRKSIEQGFGWGKLIGPMRQVTVRGVDNLDPPLTLTMAAHDLMWLRALAELRPRCVQCAGKSCK